MILLKKKMTSSVLVIVKFKLLLTANIWQHSLLFYVMSKKVKCPMLQSDSSPNCVLLIQMGNLFCP